jgi:D-glycero-beta-D-manno-heptose 1-phosphate adenylyltransferase
MLRFCHAWGPFTETGGGGAMGQVIDMQVLGEIRDELRARGQRIVLTNGHFDLLHVGHLRYLRQARQLGDVLIVGINDDPVTRQRKGPRRPILPEQERAELVAGLECVDFAVIFHEPTADALVRTLQPDVYAKGGDYKADETGKGTSLPEADVVREYGGEVRIIPLEPGHSTSTIEQRIVERWVASQTKSEHQRPGQAR